MAGNISAMHARYGKCEHKCSECDHFITHRANRTYFKCEVYGESNSEATDWRKSYTACGLFNKDTNARNIYKLLNRKARSDKREQGRKEQMRAEIEAGQITFDGIEVI